MREVRFAAVIAAMTLITAACSSSEDTTTTLPSPTTTTAADTTTTTAAETTTTVAETTTTAAAATTVDATTAIGVLQPYGDGAGAALFPPGSVEAHWYQWEGAYVVLYRGFDAQAGQEICAGNSIAVSGLGFNDVTNSPYLAEADEICVDAAQIIAPPGGVQVCGSLLYYVTAIPIDKEGTLFGTLEIGFGGGRWEGQTSETASDTGVPQFEPGLAAYELPPADVDDLGVVACAV